jgi:subtilase family serine protease
MRRPALAVLSAAAALCLSTVALATSADAAPSNGLGHRNDRVCSAPGPGSAACAAIRHDTVDATGNAVNADADATRHATPQGYGPADIRSAYKLTSATGAGRTVAIVDAYDAPTAEADLATYRSQYGLPACTTANGCFQKVSQTGSTTSLPARDGGWAQEISLDLDMVSATCPDCHILLVEARTSSFANLATAVNYAAGRSGVVAVSNSYGGSDSTGYASYYNHPGKAITASTGDSGYGVQSPASLPGVVAVGGTSLTKASNTRGWTETAWSGAGSGCSTVNTKPAYQLTSQTGCSKKANADVSAVADPNTGVAVYDSYAYQGYSGWMVFGGTSASSPIIASVYAMGGVPASTQAGATLWNHQSALFDVVGGNNGTCTTTKWCTAVSGWDGPTGLGTPNGTAAF